MAPYGGNVSKNHSSSTKIGSSRRLLRKGPWTVQEDAMLMDYVKKHGEGNWNSIQRNSWLMRCGKSCRLRWANHLRPNLKKGAFTPEEERLILELHAKFGNKWARMAAQLPGRTDNEIKNYWNTRLKRRLRAGLPIYPPDINPQHYQEQLTQPNSSSSSLSSILSSSEPQSANHNPSVSMFDMCNPLSTINNSLPQPDNSNLSNPDHQLKLCHNNNGGLALSLLSPNSPFSATSTPLAFTTQDLSASLSLPSLFDSLSFGDNAPPISGFAYNSGTGIELASIRSPMPAIGPTSSTNIGGTLGEKDDNLIVPELSRGYSGLLQDLLDESRALACAAKSKENSFVEDNDKGKSVVDYGLVEGANVNVQEDPIFSFGLEDATPGKQGEDSTIGTKENKTTSPDCINHLDDDLLTLLDNFPLVVPVPNWYDEIENDPNGQISNFVNGDVGAMDVQREDSPQVNTTTVTRDQDWDISSCCWNNMPDIYDN